MWAPLWGSGWAGVALRAPSRGRARRERAEKSAGSKSLEIVGFSSAKKGAEYFYKSSRYSCSMRHVLTSKPRGDRTGDGTRGDRGEDVRHDDEGDGGGLLAGAARHLGEALVRGVGGADLVSRVAGLCGLCGRCGGVWSGAGCASGATGRPEACANRLASKRCSSSRLARD